MAVPVDPRVQVDTSTTCEAATAANFSGPNSRPPFSWARKRAYRRARHRAQQHGGTWYRGVWRDARSLGVSTEEVVVAAPRSNRAFPTLQGRRPRVRVLTYNVGGMGSDLFDVYIDWLKGQSGLDIIVLAETHWGMGRGEAQWSRDGWHFVSTSSEISAKLAAVSDIDFQVWAPGRLLHVRVHSKHFPVDVIAIYQWVDKGLAARDNLQRRARIWGQLSRLLETVTGSVRAMWDAYKQWRQAQGRRTLRGNLFKAWRRFALFREASRRLRKTSGLARRQRIYAIIDRAASAATRDQMNELYNITRILAPRQRRERVRLEQCSHHMPSSGRSKDISARLFRTQVVFPLVALLQPRSLTTRPCKLLYKASSLGNPFRLEAFPRKSGRPVRALLPHASRELTGRALVLIPPPCLPRLRIVA